MKDFPNSYTDAELEKRTKELLGTASTPKSPLLRFVITEKPTSYTIDGIVCAKNVYSLSLLNQPLEQCKRKDPREWLSYNQANLKDYLVVSSRLQFCMLRTLYENREGPFKDLIEKMKKQLFTPIIHEGVATSTRINYSITSIDEVIHDYGLPQKEVVPVPLKGNSAWLNGMDKSIAQALLGCECREAYLVTTWISGKFAFLCRQNVPCERAVSFKSIVFNRFDISDIDSDPNEAFGVKVLSKKPMEDA